MYKKIIKNVFKKLGLEIKRYNPQDDFNFLITRCIKKFQIDCFWDIGANIGQTGLSLREHGYKGNILSFEPQEEAYNKLLKTSFKDPNWRIYEKCGLGKNGFKKINISQNSVSSSFLEMENLHLETNPESKFIKKEDVKIVSLYEAFIKEKRKFKNNFLKIDTQGYEKEVLESGESILNNFIGISCEISVQPLYKNEAKFLDIISYLNTKGYEIYSVHNSYYEINYGQTFSIDIVFIKKELFIN